MAYNSADKYRYRNYKVVKINLTHVKSLQLKDPKQYTYGKRN